MAVKKRNTESMAKPHAAIKASPANGGELVGNPAPLEEENTKLSKNEEVVVPGKIQKFTQFIDVVSKLVGVLTWPLVVIIILVLFYSPIRRVVELLPEKFEKSNEVSLGTLSFKIQEQARATGNEELANIIRGLSQEAMEWILKIGTGSHRVIASDDGRDGITKNYTLPSSLPVWKELAAKGLLKSTVDLNEYEQFFKSLGPQDGSIAKNNLTPDQEDRLLNNSVELSDSGRRAYEIIIRVVTDLIKQ